MARQPNDREELDIELINANARAQAEEIRKKEKAKTIGGVVGFLLFLVVLIPACFEYGTDTLDGIRFFGLIIWALVCGVVSVITRWIVRIFM